MKKARNYAVATAMMLVGVCIMYIGHPLSGSIFLGTGLMSVCVLLASN
jgi:hypothetical protein